MKAEVVRKYGKILKILSFIKDKICSLQSWRVVVHEQLPSGEPFCCVSKPCFGRMLERKT